MPTNLPYYCTEFVGREDEVARLRQTIASRRLVALLGPGGIGKTRLAVEVATQLKSSFSENVWLIELATLTNPASVPAWVASTLGLRENPHAPPLAGLIDALQSSKALIILDNCEQVLAACASLAASLMAQCPQVHILVTSRERLGMTGEVVWRVPPLSAPLPSSSSLAELLRYESVQLFVSRAIAVAPRFALTTEHAEAVAEICHRLDGLPLALELAAARMSMFSVEQLSGRLHERFRLLTQGDPTVAPRHHTLQATLDWSYALLSPVEQLILRRLSIFVGSWTLESVEGICTDEETSHFDLLDILTHLVDKSLVIAEAAGGLMRYRLLETVQAYALLQLRSTEGEARLHERHWLWYLRLAEEAAPFLQGEQQRYWIQYIEQECDNIRRAIERSLAANAVDITARIVCALTNFWITKSLLREARRMFEAVLARPELSQSQRVVALQSAVEILRFQGEYERSKRFLEECLSLLRAMGETMKEAEVLCSLGWAAFYQGRFEDIDEHCQAALSLFRAAHHQMGIANSLSCLALTATVQGEYTQALVWLQEVLQIRHALKDTVALIHCYNAQSKAALLAGQYELAQTACQEALTCAVLLKQPFGIAYSLETTAALASAWHHLPYAAQLFGAADMLRTVIGTPLPPSLRVMRTRELLALKVGLGDEVFAECWKEGQQFSQLQACSVAQDALNLLATRRQPAAYVSADGSYPAGLSQREIEVLRLVAAGLTDARIAEILVLSPRTVSTHLRSIYRKLDVSSRQAATRFAVEQHIV